MEETRDEVIERLGALIEEFLERFSNHLEVCVVRVHGQNLISSSMCGRSRLKQNLQHQSHIFLSKTGCN